MVEVEYLTVKEVAGHLRCHVKTLYRLITAGRLKVSRVGRTYRIPARALDALGMDVTKPGGHGR